MNIKLHIIAIVLSSTLTLSAQEETPPSDYLIGHFGRSFLGTGDLSSIISGMQYHHMLHPRLGVHLLYSRTAASDNNIHSANRISNAYIRGNRSRITSLAAYQMVGAGVTYRTMDSKRSTLLISAGLGYKWVKDIQVGGVRYRSDGETGTTATIETIHIYHNSELQGHLTIDYLYALSSHLSAGIHLAVHQSGDIVSAAGICFGARF